jgi:hypothetical protein
VSPKDKKALPVGCPPYPEPSEMPKVQLQASHRTLLRLRDLTRAAEAGDEDALQEIRKLLGERPELAWSLVDLARVAEQSLLEKSLGGDQPSVKVALRIQLQAMRIELAGENPSPLERLLVERVVATWLEVQTFQALYFQNEDKLSMAQGEHHQRRLDRAHRRHLSAIRTLAQVRKLGPAVQINIAEKQVNTAG